MGKPAAVSPSELQLRNCSGVRSARIGAQPCEVDGKTTAAGIVQKPQQASPGVDLRQDAMNFLEVARGKGWIRIRQSE
jgi:hypothetical protein